MAKPVSLYWTLIMPWCGRFHILWLPPLYITPNLFELFKIYSVRRFMLAILKLFFLMILLFAVMNSCVTAAFLFIITCCPLKRESHAYHFIVYFREPSDVWQWNRTSTRIRPPSITTSKVSKVVMLTDAVLLWSDYSVNCNSNIFH